MPSCLHPVPHFLIVGAFPISKDSDIATRERNEKRKRNKDLIIHLPEVNPTQVP
jgi:uncharacterized protein YjlB